MKKKNIAILGSTGSIGVNSLDVVRRLKRQFRVVGLGANRNVRRILDQIREFNPRIVALEDAHAAVRLKNKIKGFRRKPAVWNHGNGLEKIARLKNIDFVLSGVVGARGLLPLIAAIKAGKTVGLANKEALIIAGDLIMSLSRRHNAPIIPVDSEHSAIFQCLKGHDHGDIRRLILTASGGPFYRSKKPLSAITVSEALRHPTWKMGDKITIDSATLMNKGLEAIEAHHLFNVPMEKITIVIHPQSIVHSLVEFEDGALLAQLSHPDMRLPIQYALTYPGRKPTPIPKLELEEIKKLEFAEPDFSRFPCLGLALKAGRKGGTAPAALSAANEIAVQAFIDKRIPFTGIASLVERVERSHPFMKSPALRDILRVDRWAREKSDKLIQEEEMKRP